MERCFSWPSDSLPDDLAELPLFHGVSASHQYFPASIDHLVLLLKTVPSNKSILKHFRSTLFGLAIVVTLSFLSWFFWQNHASTYDANVLSDVPLGNGKLLFRTESFKPPDKQMGEEKNLSIGDERVMFIQDISKDDVTEIELAFQIINSSQKLITITSINIFNLGRIVLYEDRRSLSSLPHESRELSLHQRTNLGTLVFSSEDSDFETVSKAGNLIDKGIIHTVERNSLRSYYLKLRCKTDYSSQVIVLDSPRLFSRQFDSELKSLDLEAPDPVDAVHSFT